VPVQPYEKCILEGRKSFLARKEKRGKGRLHQQREKKKNYAGGTRPRTNHKKGIPETPGGSPLESEAMVFWKKKKVRSNLKRLRSKRGK